MELRFECTQCGQHISATPAQIGMSSLCPTCGATVIVPNPLAEMSTPSLTPEPPIAPPTPQPPPEAVPQPSVLPFVWWPRSRAGATFAAVVLVFVFLVSITGGFFGALFSVGFTFLLLTGLRYGLYRIRPPTAKPASDSAPAPKTPLWRHPVTIGVSICCVLFLFIAIQSSNDSSTAQQQYAAALQQNKAAYDEHNSTGNAIGLGVESFARGFLGDTDGVIRRTNEVEAQNRAFAARDSQLRAGYAAAASSGSDAGALIVAVLFILFALVAFFLFQRFKSRQRKKALNEVA